MTPNILTGLAPFNASQATGSQLSSLVSMSGGSGGGPALRPPMSPLTSVSPGNR
jgi:hypothetical protein